MESDDLRPLAHPLPRPNQDRLEDGLEEKEHLEFWILILKQYDAKQIRSQSRMLYINSIVPYLEGEES